MTGWRTCQDQRALPDVNYFHYFYTIDINETTRRTSSLPFSVNLESGGEKISPAYQNLRRSVSGETKKSPSPQYAINGKLSTKIYYHDCLN
jgi:hypothetical protein